MNSDKMNSKSKFSDMFLSWRSLLLQPLRSLGLLPFSDLIHFGQGHTISSSPSIDSNSFQSYKYDVFISFRGPDTRDKFVSHLYAHLTTKGIFVFKDDKRLEKGESLSPQLLQAITNSRISIVVFSKNYAESSWCLEEMATIAECRTKLKQIVFPVFYDVDPSHVRKQGGVYQNAFVLLKKKFRHDPSKVVRWTDAMVDLANLVGWDVRDKPEFREIKNIVQEDLPCLKRVDLSNSKCLVETPNFAGSRRLERLDLTGCINLTYVHPSIGLLEQLAFLSLEGCSSLVSLVVDGDTTSNLYSLKVLHLSGCPKLEIIPDFTGVSNLEYLDIDQCTNLSRIDQSIANLTQLKFLSLRDCTNLVSMPNSINHLTTLVTLDLCGCIKLENLPLGKVSVPSEIEIVDLSYYLESLIFLDLSFCNLSTVPDAIGDLRHLERLNLEGNNFVSLPSSMGRLLSLAYLNLANCSRLQSLPPLECCATSASGGKYFRILSGSHNHRSGLYIFNCPLLKITQGGQNLALSWLKRLVENPHNFRCGFDIVVPGLIIPEWYDRQFIGNPRVRISDFINELDNWLGFAFCVAFVENSGSMSSSSPCSFSSQPPYPLYLSFESEHVEETFDITLRLDQSKVDGLNKEHLWLIYISRPHCHFVTTGAHITFKAHPYIELKAWGLRMVFEDIYSLLTLGTNEVIRQGYLHFDHVHENGSSSRPEVQLPYNWYAAKEGIKPKIQLRYNWQVTEEEEIEDRELNVKQNHLLDMGLTTQIEDDLE